MALLAATQIDEAANFWRAGALARAWPLAALLNGLSRPLPQPISCDIRLGNRCMMWWIDTQCRKTGRNYGCDGLSRSSVRAKLPEKLDLPELEDR
ncbi:MAG TPA: hypothetical protein PLZ95_09230, partial [Bryobacteraceae bacterium]|nr:hypothetical protein [Bryobacteraceae bacterium]